MGDQLPCVPPLPELLDIPQILHLPDIFNILNFLDYVFDLLNTCIYSEYSLIFSFFHESLLIFLVHPFFSFKKSCQQKEFCLQLMQDLDYASPPPSSFSLSSLIRLSQLSQIQAHHCTCLREIYCRNYGYKLICSHFEFFPTRANFQRSVFFCHCDSLSP